VSARQHSDRRSFCEPFAEEWGDALDEFLVRVVDERLVKKSRGVSGHGRLGVSTARQVFS